MPVYQDSGPGIGAGLQAGVQGFLGAQQKKKNDALFEQELADQMYNRTRQRASDAQAGMHILAPGESQPWAAISADATSGVRVPPPAPLPAMDMNAPGASPLAASPSAAPGSPPRTDVQNIPGHPSNRAAAVAPAAGPAANFEAQMAPALAGMAPTQAPSRGPRYETGQGYYIDHQPAWNAADTARAQHVEDQFTPALVSQMMAQQERQRKLQGYVSAGIPADRAQLYVDNPALAENDPKVGKPVSVPKDERMQSRIKDLVTGGMPLSQASARARIEFGDADPLAEHQANRLFDVAHPTADPAIAATRADNVSTRNESRIVTQYTNATKKYSQTADAIQAINENRAGALRGDPIAQQTLLQDFIKLNLPGQQVTAGELHHYADLMGLGDKAGQLLQKLQQGSPLSQTQVKLILGHADNLVAERRKGLGYIRDQFAQRATREKVDPQALVDWFGFLPDGATAPPPSGAGGDTGANPFSGLIPKKP